MKPPKELMKRLVSESSSYKEVSRKLRKLDYYGKRPKLAKKYIVEYGLDVDHFVVTTTKYTKEVLKEAIKDSYTWADVSQYFKLRPHGGSNYNFKRRAIAYGIDFSHFKSRGWSKSRVFANKRKTAEEVLILHPVGKHIHGHMLRRSLLEIGRDHLCEICGQLPVWENKPLILEVDHINGVKRDCRSDNLRIVCLHCHSQTETYKGRNKNNTGIVN